MLKSGYQHYRQLIPALLLAACCLIAVATAIKGSVVLAGEAYGFKLSAKHYGAIVAALATIACFFLARKYYGYLLLLALLLGGFNFIAFNALDYSAGLTFGDLHIGLNPCILAIGILTYLLNYRRTNDLLFELVKPSPEKAARLWQEEVAGFKERFSHKSKQELAQIVAANQLVPAAILAARELLLGK